MSDSAALMEMKRRQHQMRKRREARDRMMANCSNTSTRVRMPVSLRAEPVPDYPHDKGRDIFGIGGYDDSPTNRLHIDDMLESLQFAVDGGNLFLPHIYQSLRRRQRLLRDNLLTMGSLTAFADYFPLWTTAGGDDQRASAPADERSGRCDACKMMAPTMRRRPTPWY